MLNKLMFYSMNLTPLKDTGIKDNLTNYLKENPDKIYNIKIVDGELAQEFIKTAEDFSKSALGKNVFNIEVVKDDSKY